MVIYLRWIVALALVYLALTSNLEPSNIVVGLLLAGGVVALIRPPRRPTQPRRPLRSVVASARYVLTLGYDMVVSGVQVARIVLSPSLPIRPGIVAIPAETNTDLGIALSAHAVSLTPGELVVEIDDDHMMYTHCLDATHAETYIKDAHDLRIELLNEIVP